MVRLLVLVTAVAYDRESNLRKGLAAIEVSSSGQLEVATTPSSKGKVNIMPEVTADSPSMASVSDGEPCVNKGWDTADTMTARSQCLTELASADHKNCADADVYAACKDLCGGCTGACSDKMGTEYCQQKLSAAQAMDSPCSNVDTMHDCMLTCEKCSADTQEDAAEECDPDDLKDDSTFVDILGSSCADHYAITVDGVSQCDKIAAETVGRTTKYGAARPISAGNACCKSCSKAKVDIDVDANGDIVYVPYSAPAGNCVSAFQDDPNWRDKWDDGCEYYGESFEASGSHKKMFDDETNCDRFDQEFGVAGIGGKDQGPPVYEACCLSCKKRNARRIAADAQGTCTDDPAWRVCEDGTCDQSPSATAWKCTDFHLATGACSDDNFGDVVGRSPQHDGAVVTVKQACCYACGEHGLPKAG